MLLNMYTRTWGATQEIEMHFEVQKLNFGKMD